MAEPISSRQLTLLQVVAKHPDVARDHLVKAVATDADLAYLERHDLIRERRGYGSQKEGHRHRNESHPGHRPSQDRLEGDPPAAMPPQQPGDAPTQHEQGGEREDPGHAGTLLSSLRVSKRRSAIRGSTWRP